MARKLVVEVIADLSQYVKSLKVGEHATSTFTKEVTVDAATVAKAQVAAAIKSTEALEKEAAAYRQVAAQAEKGSKEQIAAARLAESAERKLASQLGRTAGEASTLHARSRTLERDMSHAARGALSGSHAFGSLTRSLAFASGGFIAFHSAAEFLRESVDASREAVVSQRSLAAQMKASGESFARNKDRVEEVALSYGKFGFQNDEVIAGLTVLERGTGNVSKSLGLLTLTGDIARAKGIGLAQSAQVVAKVFGGQETALRRAVPGLSKHAHGMDLIRLASVKMAGQMAANTTAADRFHAVLHDTQEIVGTALLPTLNRYLDQLSHWLDRMNRSGKLQRDVAQTAHVLTAALAAVKAAVEPLVIAFQALAKAVGGNKRAFELLLGVWASFKALKIAGGILDTVAALGKASAEGRGLTHVVARLRLSMLRLVANPYTIAIVATFVGAEYIAKKVKDLQEKVIKAQEQGFKKADPVETILVPRLAKQIEAMKKAGKSMREILATLRKQMGGSLKGDDLIAEAFAFSSGSDPKLQQRIRNQVDKRAKEAIKTAKTELDKQVRTVPVETRNTWFDQLISRLLGGVEDTPTGAPAALDVQLARLRDIAARLEKRIAATKDITRKLNLQSQLQDVLNREWQTQQEINQKTADLAEKAARQRAARQFGALGLGPTGDTRTPGIDALRKQAAAVRDAIEGTFLDTRKNQSLLAHIRQVLSGNLGKVGQDVRAKIKEILDGIRNDLKGAQGFATRYSPASPQALMAAFGFNLTADQRRRMQAVLAQLGPHGLVAPSRSQAFALAGAGGVTINGDVHVHGVTDVKSFENQLTKRHAARPHVRRGAR